jgi:ketosteroid isomerase-like protein
MSQENAELVRRAYDAWNDRDLDAMAAFAAADFTLDWSNALSVDVLGTYEGTPAWQELFREMWDMWDQVSMEPKELIAAGDHVVAPVRFRAIGRGGVEVEAAQTAHVWTIGEGQLLRCKLYQSKQEALEALGLSE